MSMGAALAIGFAVAVVTTQFWTRGVAPAGWTALLLWNPPTAFVGGVVSTAGLLLRRLQARRRRAAAAEADVLLLAELIGLGLSAGLGLAAALEAALPELTDELGAEVRAVLRRAPLYGLAQAMSASRGRSSALLRTAGRSVATGAPLGPTVATFAEQLRRTRRADELTEARRLPVRLLLPLALLILPGFVVLTLGPAVLAGVERLEFSLPAAIGR